MAKVGANEILSIDRGDNIQFRGGAITKGEIAHIPFGGYSMIQNMRNRHPGLEQRGGCRAKHSEADGTNKVLSLYQFSKGKRTERHFFAQMSDGDVLEATTAPPGIDTTFGSEAHDGTATGQCPASWANVDDLMLYSNGADQHQIYAGTANHVKRFIKFDGAAAPPDIPTDGINYTRQVTDGLTTTMAILDSLNTLAAYECLFICTPVPANRLTWTFYTGRANSTAAVGTLSYRKSDNTWADTTENDGTIAATGKTLGQDGSMTWTHPSDEIPHYMFGICGFWYRWTTDTQLDAEVEVTDLTYGSAFQDIVNVWDGTLKYATEAKFFKDTGETYLTFGSDTIEIDSMTSSGKVYFCVPDPIAGIYIDVGETPNSTASTTINAVYTWTGATWTSVGTITDGTSGMANSGFVTWGRPDTEPQMTQFQTSRHQAYWYYFTVDKTLDADIIISIEVMPYFNIEELGRSQACCAWKDKAVYSFTMFPQFGYIAKKDNPLCLNGDGYGIVEAGDGRANKILAWRQFHNEVIAFQEEKGKEGGCVTLFEGKAGDPTSYGKLLLSSKLGILNSKCAVVVDGVLTSTATEEVVKTLAFWISIHGVCVTDGRICTIISDDIANYFDPKETTTCIRRGYEAEHWMEYDSCDNVLRLGLVCGASATVPNIFPVFDLTDKTWSFDDHQYPFSCMTEVEAASGNIPMLQYAGGTADGTVYQLNYGTNDVSTEIDAYATMELDKGGLELEVAEMLLRVKAQAAGDVTITPYYNGVAQTSVAYSMTPLQTNEVIRKNRDGFNFQDNHISIKFQNATASQSIYLLDVGMDVYAREEH